MNSFKLGLAASFVIGALSMCSLVHAQATDAVTFQASLINPQHEASEAAVGIQLSDIQGVKLVDPDKQNEVAKQGQAHVHYQLDSNPIVATTDTKITFHHLSPGKHTVTITLAGNNHQPVSAPKTLEITIPDGAKG